MTLKRLMLCLGTLLLSWQTAVIAQADFPNRPIRFLVPFPAGGPADAGARKVAQYMQEALGQPIVVDNRPGAGGNIATEAGARAVPDGYTMLVGHVSPLAFNPALYANLPFDPLKDFAPVVMTAQTPMMFVAAPAFAPNTLGEVIAFAKANPGKVNYASTGAGGITHVGMELFKIRTGTDMLHVPYKGNAPAMIDLMSGKIEFMFEAISGVAGHIRSGKLKAIAVAADRRSAVLPDVPTTREAGLDDFAVYAWGGIVVPAKTPHAVVAKLNAVANKALQTEDVRNFYQNVGSEPVGGTPETYAARIKADLERWSAVIRRLGIRLD
jgi:tripartite-type tricarboxylate transporter receptor subunit TctC